MQEFGFGFYDGISGLVTQPLEGAKKEGMAGFVKGFGKGIGGVVLKPGAGEDVFEAPPSQLLILQLFGVCQATPLRASTRSFKSILALVFKIISLPPEPRKDTRSGTIPTEKSGLLLSVDGRPYRSS